MNCPQARDLLPLFVYGDLAPGDAAAVETHLAACVDCRRERDALSQVRQALDAAPPAAAEVDLPRLYRTAAKAQERRFRRWRRAALALGALAAALVIAALLPGLEFRCEAHQFTLRWGAPPALPDPPAPAPREPEPARIQIVSETAPDVEERLRLLSDLVQLLSADADARDARRRRELDVLRAQLNDVRDQSQRWRLLTERDVAALYAIQFPDARKGKEP